VAARGSRGSAIAFTLLSAAAVAPLWIGELPPLSDLPQHAAQVSILRHWNDPACGYPALYEFRWFDPYGLGYALAWALAGFVPIVTALRIVLSAVVVGLAFATRRALAALGGDPDWALLVLPLAYGFPLSGGFYPFVVAVPLVVALLPAGFRYAREPRLGAGLALGALCAALYFAHVLALAAAGLLLAALAAAAARSARELSRRWAPLAVALPAPLAWWLLSPAGDRGRQASAPYIWGAERLLDLPVQLTGIPGRGWAALALALVLASLAWTRPRPARELVRWAPFAVVALFVLFAPTAFYLAPRFAILLFPALLLAFDRAKAPLPLLRRAQVAALALALLALVGLRFAAIAREGAGLGEVLARAPAGGRLLYLPFDRDSRFATEPPFLHSGALYAVDRCGVAEKSFARNFQLPVEYRSGAATPLPGLIEYMPYRFRWDRDAGESYDLFLVRMAAEPNVAKIAGGEGRLAPLAHAGRWWLYANAAKRSAPRPAP
jgi:hypothetical protein